MKLMKLWPGYGSLRVELEGAKSPNHRVVVKQDDLFLVLCEDWRVKEYPGPIQLLALCNARLVWVWDMYLVDVDA